MALMGLNKKLLEFSKHPREPAISDFSWLFENIIYTSTSLIS